jgi:hypothetical protein
LARIARLSKQDRRWSIHYQWVVEGVEGHLEVRSVDSDLLRADHVDPSDVDAVTDHIEGRLQSEGFDSTRRPGEPEPIAASWDIRRSSFRA